MPVKRWTPKLLSPIEWHTEKDDSDAAAARRALNKLTEENYTVEEIEVEGEIVAAPRALFLIS